MTKVAFISRDGYQPPDAENWEPSGTTWHRCILPARALNKYGGIEAETFHMFAQNTKTGQIYPATGTAPDLELHDGYDVIVFCRWMLSKGSQQQNDHGFMGGESIGHITEMAQGYGQKIVQDLDDWLWGIPTQNFGFHWITSNPMENLKEYGKACAKADLITVSTQPLADRMARFRTPVVVVPNMLDMADWPWEQYPESLHRPAKTIGWTGSTAFRGGDLETLKGVIGPFMRKHGLKFIHGGAAPGQIAAGVMMGLHGGSNPAWMQDVPSEYRSAVPARDYPSLFEGMDIFIAPLNDRPFNECKSACKIMEASAAGVPYVASFYGPYKTYQGGGSTAKKAKDWLRNLERLMDPQERGWQRARQREIVAGLDIQWKWKTWADALA